MRLLGFLSLLFSRLLCFFLHARGGGSFPDVLCAEEEKRFFQLARQGDRQAREQLILHNMRLVAHIVKKFSNPQNQDDLMSIGTIGLIKAIDSFDPANGVRFATYAGKCLQNEILMYYRSQKKLSNEVSINESIDMDREGNPLTYMDIICCEDTIADDLDIKIRGTRARTLIRTRLSEREREILTLRYGLDGDDPMTQREIAARLGISRSYVSRIEKAALEKLQPYL